ncbi:unnamed protein product [Ectocarpus sp. CCAP 1310/34]|nr:unnamed protein product [Ectocarpus sp. CCAP 1310/34]
MLLLWAVVSDTAATGGAGGAGGQRPNGNNGDGRGQHWSSGGGAVQPQQPQLQVQQYRQPQQPQRQMQQPYQQPRQEVHMQQSYQQPQQQMRHQQTYQPQSQMQSHRQPQQQRQQQQPAMDGVGGIYDCGCNAVYHQPESPPPPGAPMGTVHRCGRCGRHGHHAIDCAAPRRFEGTSGACDQYGHMWRNCAKSNRHPHLNVVTSAGALGPEYAYTTADTSAVQFRDVPAADGVYYSDTMLAGAGGGGNGGGGAGGGGSGGGDGGGGGGVIVQQQVVTPGEPYLILPTFFTAAAAWKVKMAAAAAVVWRRERALRRFATARVPSVAVSSRCTLSVPLPHPPPCAKHPTFPTSPGFDGLPWRHRRRSPRGPFWGKRVQQAPAAPGGATSHAWRRQAHPEVFGDLDVIFHCPEDVRVTPHNVGVVPGLALDILSLNKIQGRHEIKLNRHGASILGGRVRMTKFPYGDYIQGTRVDPLPQGDSPPQPPAMVAVMLRPGTQSSIDYNALHCSLGHANSKTLYETARQMGIKVTGTPEYCDGCAESKAIQRSVPKVISPSRRTTRPLERVAMDLAGPFGQSSGGAKYYVMQILDHHTNYGWICFLREKSSTNVVAAFRAWYASIKSLVATHGGLGCVLIDNGTEWVNAEFRGLLAELNITRELTAVDGPKSNGRVERRIALVMEGGKAAFLEFPKLFPGVMFPTKALSFRAIWPEAFAWMNDSLNIAAEVSKEDKRCPEVKLYGRRRIRVLLPFMMPGFRHRHRPSTMHSKGERCFYLNSGQDHSSTTYKISTPTGVPTYS